MLFLFVCCYPSNNKNTVSIVSHSNQNELITIDKDSLFNNLKYYDYYYSKGDVSGYIVFEYELDEVKYPFDKISVIIYMPNNDIKRYILGNSVNLSNFEYKIKNY